MSIPRIYLTLTILGILGPLIILTKTMIDLEWDFGVASFHLQNFLYSPIGKVIMLWLGISGTSLTVFMVHESYYRREFRLLWAIPVLLVFSISAALPLYLYLRTPKRDE